MVRLQPRRVSILGESLLTTRVYPICEDHTGSIWVGTSSSGIYRFHGTNATRYGPGEMPLTEVWSIFEDICFHLMNLAYAHQQKIGWNPEKLHFAEGSGDPKWLTCDYCRPWKV
jgi:hypothetical protein